MSAASKSLNKLRIIAVPLTRSKVVARRDAPAALTYYQFQIGDSHHPTTRNSLENGNTRSRWRPEGGYLRWITTKAADTWAGFGKAKGGWKLKVFQVGERLVDRLDFEELALKGIDPSVGPTVTGTSSDATGQKHEEKIKIPLIYPPSIKSGSITLAELRALVAYRTPRHRRGFYLWMIIAPFTAPFMIIPYRASEYLQTLIDNDALVPQASDTFDMVYREHSPMNTAITPPGGSKVEDFSQSNPSTEQHELLLTRDAVPAILRTFGLNPSSGADLLRAVEQARVRVRSGRGIL
ncbi:hypothetical protein H0H93_014223 [Arthromyces matolae]|nr:hypothetical protein H0H93_014223 [Arthromyces matolae]